MAITNYAELKAAAANWLVRADLTARIPEFIALAEARLNRVMRTRLAETDVAVTAAAGARKIPLPTGFAEPVGLWLQRADGRAALPFIEASLISVSSQAGEPQAWTVDGGDIAFDRPCGQACSLTFRVLKGFSLSESAPTNALLNDFPDIYLFATLGEAAPFLRDPELAAAYETKLGRAIAEANAKEARSRVARTLRSELPDLIAGRSAGC